MALTLTEQQFYLRSTRLKDTPVHFAGRMGFCLIIGADTSGDGFDLREQAQPLRQPVGQRLFELMMTALSCHKTIPF